jgi:hypothetical protein
MEMCSPKRRFELELNDTKSQNASIIDTAVKASQRRVFPVGCPYGEDEQLLSHGNTTLESYHPEDT